jgi:uracil-DNA glycosylase
MHTAVESPDLSITWRDVLSGEREKDYFVSLLQFIESERAKGKVIYPPNAEVFTALSLTPFAETKVVVIGQDPYHGPGQAHGLCFSVKPGVPHPPSLQNIFKELHADLGVPVPRTGCLEPWARQGVLLLNTVLTVEAGRAGSHAGMGWERFTDRIIAELNSRTSGLVFMLWGAFAQKKAAAVDPTRHLLLKAAHPSPLSVRGFFGCRHFSKTNQYLESSNRTPIAWELPS